MYQLKNGLKPLLLATLLSTALGNGGCYSYRVASSKNDPTTIYNRKVVHSYLWGLAQKDKIGIHAVTHDCDDLDIYSLSEVKVKTNLLYSLATVLTLGIWCPMEVQWKCAKPCNPPGVID
ncbi:MAG: hypothetical protein IPM42_14740 [Saprospiraceae bacterium]|nr:hypothetical protein [Saprospiraceae bacterium]